MIVFSELVIETGAEYGNPPHPSLSLLPRSLPHSLSFYSSRSRARVGFDSLKILERNTGIEPVPSPWKGDVLPLYESRFMCTHYTNI